MVIMVKERCLNDPVAEREDLWYSERMGDRKQMWIRDSPFFI